MSQVFFSQSKILLCAAFVSVHPKSVSESVSEFLSYLWRLQEDERKLRGRAAAACSVMDRRPFQGPSPLLCNHCVTTVHSVSTPPAWYSPPLLLLPPSHILPADHSSASAIVAFYIAIYDCHLWYHRHLPFSIRNVHFSPLSSVPLKATNCIVSLSKYLLLSKTKNIKGQALACTGQVGSKQGEGGRPVEKVNSGKVKQ